MLTNNELTGFRVVDVVVHTTPDSWVSGEQFPAQGAAAEKAMLKRDGFRAGVHENLMKGDGHGRGVGR